MAAGDILSLKNSMASRLIRCLYMLALILIAVMVVLGVARGVRIMSFTPRPRPAAAAPPAPDAAQAPQAGQPQMGMMQGAPNGRMMTQGNGRMMMNPRMRGPGMIGPRAPFGLGRNPVAAGLFAIFFTLLRGVVVLMVVRILAEIGLAILAMPRRSES
jgi:hypothetical protein